MAAALWMVEMFAVLPWPELVHNHQVSGNNSLGYRWAEGDGQEHRVSQRYPEPTHQQGGTKPVIRGVCVEKAEGNTLRGTREPRLTNGHAERAGAPLPA